MTSRAFFLKGREASGLRIARADIYSMCACTAILAGFTASSDQFLHWFAIPVWLCGILIGRDAVNWFLGRLPLLDPVGLMGLLGFHFFFLAPLLHVSWNYWIAFVPHPPEWRDWLGGMAILNIFGLLVYRASRHMIYHTLQARRLRTVWTLDKNRFYVVLSLVLLLTAGMQIWIYLQKGGILGFILSYVDRPKAGGAFDEMGWQFMIAESFPILALMGFAVYARSRKTAKTWFVLGIVILAFFILKMLFGGLRGSRSNTIWGLFWALGMVHFYIRPVSKQIIYAGVAFLLLFMYIYGFYKGGGLEGLRALEGPEARAELAQQTGRTIAWPLLVDLAHSDLQAFLLYRLWTDRRDYQYAWGKTYLGTAALLIPQSIWPGRPPTKLKEGTEVQYGLGSYSPGIFRSSRIYGLAGEGMLNFTPLAVPLLFLLPALVVAYAGYFQNTLGASDSRLLLLPLLISLCFAVLVHDSDNILFFLVKNGAVPFLIVLLCSRRRLIEFPQESGRLVANR